MNELKKCIYISPIGTNSAKLIIGEVYKFKEVCMLSYILGRKEKDWKINLVEVYDLDKNFIMSFNSVLFKKYFSTKVFERNKKINWLIGDIKQNNHK